MQGKDDGEAVLALPLLPLIIIGFGVLTVVGIVAAILTGNTGE